MSRDEPPSDGPAADVRRDGGSTVVMGCGGCDMGGGTEGSPGYPGGGDGNMTSPGGGGGGGGADGAGGTSGADDELGRNMSRDGLMGSSSG